MTCTAPRHGTRAAYVADRCRCPEARKANREYAAYRDKRLAQAKFGAAAPLSVDATETRSVLLQLRGIGWSMRRIEAETGIGRDHLQRILGHTKRPCRRVLHRTHMKLVALAERENPTVADGALVDAQPTWRLIHGMIALGYPKTWIARQIGVGRAIQFNPHLITAANARKVRDLAARTITAGPSDAARRYAAAHGWTAELLLPEDDLAEPVEMFGVDRVAVERFVAGEDVPLNRAEKYEAWVAMRDAGLAGNEAQRRLHLSGTTVSAFIARSVSTKEATG